KIYRWARLQVPNGQIARSAWKETLKSFTQLRMARNIKFLHREEQRFGEVLYYLLLTINEDEPPVPMAMVLPFSAPEPTLLQRSSTTFKLCTKLSNQSLMLVSIKAIMSVVAAVPYKTVTRDHADNRWYVAEKPGL
ncbi:hypothetical protein NEOLEDRAFT_1034185, partial [Neolentinus lepideus HHB14362 ss-1]